MKNSAEKYHQQALQQLHVGEFEKTIELLNRAIDEDPCAAELFNHLGNVLMQTGQNEEAENAYLKALEIDPDNHKILNNLGVSSSYSGDVERAIDYFAAAIHRNPTYYDAIINLGNVYYKANQLDKAEEWYRRAILADSKQCAAYGALGRVLSDKKNFADAEAMLRLALKIKPDMISALVDLGLLLRKLTRKEEAIACFEKVTELAPMNVHGWHYLVDSVEFVSKLEDAQKIILQGRKYHPNLPVFSLIEAKIARRKNDYNRALSILEPVLQVIALDDPDNASFFFEMGQIYDHMNLADKAFECFEKGNQMQSRSVDALDAIQKSEIIKQIEDCKTVFCHEWLNNWTPPYYYNENPKPIFLVGFPRSGTTLLGQILSSHPEIAVADEKSALAKVMSVIKQRDNLQYPNCLSLIERTYIDELRKIYFESHDRDGVNLHRPFLIDKMPLNMVRAGLIHRIFPGAKFILALRHPCDCVLSCYMQHFGMNESMVRFLNLHNTADMYEKVFALWEQYRELLPLNVHVVKYENLIERFSETIEDTLNFINVPWNDAVMEYDRKALENTKINTPSYSQITEKIYNRASGRWLHYKEQIKPVLDILSPWAERYGYRV